MAEDHRLAYLQRMGIRVWVPRVPVPFAFMPEAVAAEDALSPKSEPEKTAMSPPEAIPARAAACPHNWDDLAAEVSACTACPLHEGRTQTVFGVGNREAEWMFVGEAPGEQEDLQGEPFVGRAGQLLNEMIRAIGLRREDVYIANVLKCRPPKNRDPAPEEAAACEGYLKAQLALVRPKIILAVGRIAAQNLLKTATPIGKLRGQVHDYEQIPLVVTYHPAYLLRSQTEKRRAWEDLKLALRMFRERAQ
jgi:uracil-DNA glycosylase family 4